MRRATAGVGATLLVVLAVGIAEATLLLLLFVMSSALRLYTYLELGSRVLGLSYPGYYTMPMVVIHQAGMIGSILFTLACGLAAAMWRYRRWKPSS